MNKVVLLILGAVVVIGLIAVAATSHHSHMGTMPMSTNALSSDQQNAVATSSVSIQNFNFGPAAVKVKVGTAVNWANQDSVHHTVTMDSASGDGPKSGELGKDQKYSFTFKTAGTYAYHCAIHPSMHGTVIVTN